MHTTRKPLRQQVRSAFHEAILVVLVLGVIISALIDAFFENDGLRVIALLGGLTALMMWPTIVKLRNFYDLINNIKFGDDD